MRIHLKSPCQIHLQQRVVINGVDARNIQVIAAGAEFVIDALGVAATDCADDGVSEAIGKCRVNTLQVGATFKKVGVHLCLDDLLFQLDKLDCAPSSLRL